VVRAGTVGAPRTLDVGWSVGGSVDVAAAATDRFVDWVRHGVDPGQTYRDSLRVMEASFAAEESLHNGGKVVHLASA
jgi:hypothetical protein